MVPTIHIKNATLAYDKKTIFSHLNIDINAGKWVALLGPSGVGKSSFLRMMAHLTAEKEETYGIIYADNGVPVFQQVAYMAQTDLLLPWLTLLQNVTLKLKLRSHTREEIANDMLKATSLLGQAGLGDAMDLYPYQLSGGMRQRAALVRTLMEEKPIILMDEPFSALDAITRYKLQELAIDLLKNKTVVFVTHDPAEALRLADEIYIMQGNPATLKAIATLSSTAPRELAEPELISLQGLLFQELTQAVGEWL